jgi:hypothetical protein
VIPSGLLPVDHSLQDSCLFRGFLAYRLSIKDLEMSGAMHMQR